MGQLRLEAVDLGSKLLVFRDEDLELFFRLPPGLLLLREAGVEEEGGDGEEGAEAAPEPEAALSAGGGEAGEERGGRFGIEDRRQRLGRLRRLLRLLRLLRFRRGGPWNLFPFAHGGGDFRRGRRGSQLK